jgi:hypothetical protein
VLPEQRRSQSSKLVDDGLAVALAGDQAGGAQCGGVCGGLCTRELKASHTAAAVDVRFDDPNLIADASRNKPGPDEPPRLVVDAYRLQAPKILIAQLDSR